MTVTGGALSLTGGGITDGTINGATDVSGFPTIKNSVSVHNLHAITLKLIGFKNLLSPSEAFWVTRSLALLWSVISGTPKPLAAIPRLSLSLFFKHPCTEQGGRPKLN